MPRFMAMNRKSLWTCQVQFKPTKHNIEGLSMLIPFVAFNVGDSSVYTTALQQCRSAGRGLMIDLLA